MDQDQGKNRGLLDLDVTQSSQDIMAGQNFSIYVLVKNPFDTPIWIKRVHVSVPSEIDLPQWNAYKIEQERKKERKEEEAKKREEANIKAIKEEAERRIEIESIEAKIADLEKQIGEKINNPSANLQQQEIQTLKIRRQELLLPSEAFRQGGMQTSIIATGDAQVDFRDSEWEGAKITATDNAQVALRNLKSKNLEGEAEFARSIDLEGSLPEGAALQPGNTAVYTIIMKTKNFLLFRPSQYRLQFSVNFCFARDSKDERVSGNLENSEDLFANTVAASLSIRASIYSVIIGSALGGLLGAVARLLQSEALTFQNLPNSLVSISLSIILSITAIIFLARKSGTQSFVSVEDLWGGMLIGFLVGYSGVSFFENLTGISSVTIQNPTIS